MSGRTNGLGATNTVFAQNIVQGGGEAAGLAGPYTGGAWSGNLIWQNSGPGDMPAGTYDEIDPLLEPKSNGVFRPQPGSPAIDSATGDYPAVAFDHDGQPRTGPKDRGGMKYQPNPSRRRC